MSRASDAYDKIIESFDTAIDGLTEGEQDEVFDRLLDFLDCYWAKDATHDQQLAAAFNADFPLTEFDPMALQSDVPACDPSLN